MILALLWMALGCAGGDKAAEDTSQVDPDPDPDPEACIQPTLDVQVGTGSMSYTPLNDGDPVTLVHGPQGGWHILGSVWINHTNPIVRIHFEATTEAEGVLISGNNYTVMLVSDGECSGFFPGMYGYVSVMEMPGGETATPPELLGGKAVILRMTAEDEEGNIGEGQVRVVVELDPADVGGAAP